MFIVISPIGLCFNLLPSLSFVEMKVTIVASTFHYYLSAQKQHCYLQTFESLVSALFMEHPSRLSHSQPYPTLRPVDGSLISRFSYHFSTYRLTSVPPYRVSWQSIKKTYGESWSDWMLPRAFQYTGQYLPRHRFVVISPS